MPAQPIHVTGGPVYAYDPTVPPLVTVTSGTSVVVDTRDARDGALDDREPGSLFELPRPPVHGNPLSGPIAVQGAQPGDSLRVTIEAIELAAAGWAGGHAHVNPLSPGRVPRPIGRRVAVTPDGLQFSDRLTLALRPMIGCLGTATAAAPDAGRMGRWGGNLDHPILGVGATVYLPVEADGALLYVGDVHAAQGDGELSGVALEIAARVTLRLELVTGLALVWPWVETADRLAVLTSDEDFVIARRASTEAMVSALEQAFGMEPAEALALVSIAGDLRLGQSMGRGPMTLRLEVPRWPGLVPA